MPAGNFDTYVVWNYDYNFGNNHRFSTYLKGNCRLVSGTHYRIQIFYGKCFSLKDITKFVRCFDCYRHKCVKWINGPLGYVTIHKHINACVAVEGLI